jgi:two-component system chemotaxis response regulator CheY
VNDILIVEDDVQVRRALARALSGEGYSVALSGNGQEALEHLEGRPAPPDVIIMDLLMPVMDGWRLRERLLARPAWAHVPVIVFSGSGCDQAGGAALGDVHYIAKPVSLRGLFDSVARLISATAATRAETARRLLAEARLPAPGGPRP